MMEQSPAILPRVPEYMSRCTKAFKGYAARGMKRAAIRPLASARGATSRPCPAASVRCPLTKERGVPTGVKRELSVRGGPGSLRAKQPAG